MTEPRSVLLLLDEQLWLGLAATLREKGYDVVHLTELGFRGANDERVLQVAAENGRALLTNNHRHFVPLARKWYESHRYHAGIILTVSLPPGELLRLTENLLQADPFVLQNTVRWLQEFA